MQRAPGRCHEANLARQAEVCQDLCERECHLPPQFSSVRACACRGCARERREKRSYDAYDAMSRYDARDDVRSAWTQSHLDDRLIGRLQSRGKFDDHPGAPARTLSLPRGEEREAVALRDRTYHLNGAESCALATVGAFRVAPTDDLGDGRSRDVWTTTFRPLADQALIERKSVVLDQQRTSVVVLTRARARGLKHVSPKLPKDGVRSSPRRPPWPLAR